MSKNKTAMIRRIVAIALTALSILFLFWPAMISVKSSSRERYLKNYKEYMEEIEEEGGRSTIVSERAKELTKYYDYSSSDAKALANAVITERIIGKKPEMSLSDLRTVVSAMMTEVTITEKYEETKGMYDNDSEEVGKVRISAIMFNILFWSLIAAAIAAILLYLFNKTKAAGVIYAILAVLNAVWVFIFLLITKSSMWPGVSMFLLPIFAIAAFIVYKRDPKITAQPVNPQQTDPLPEKTQQTE